MNPFLDATDPKLKSRKPPSGWRFAAFGAIRVLSTPDAIASQLAAYGRDYRGQNGSDDLKQVLCTIKQRRARLIDLFNAGMTTTRLRGAYMLNCRPCGMAVKGSWRPCTHRTCPFCWGRSVAKAATAMSDLAETLHDESWKLVMLARTREFDPKLSPRYTCLDDIDQAEFRGYMLAGPSGYRRYRRDIARRIAPVFGGVFATTVEPLAFQQIAVDGSRGWWRLRLRAAFLASADWQVPTTPRHPDKLLPGNWEEHGKCDRFQLARQIGRHLEYPRKWWSCDPICLVKLARWLHNEKIFTYFIRLR